MATGPATITDFSRGVRVDRTPTGLQDGEIRPSRNIWLPDLNGYPSWRPVANRIDKWDPSTNGLPTGGYFPNVPITAASFVSRDPGDTVVIVCMGLGYSLNSGMPGYTVHAQVGGVRQDYGLAAADYVRSATCRPQILIWNNKAYIFDGGEDPGWVLERNGASAQNNGTATFETGLGINRTFMKDVWPVDDQPLASIAWVHQGQIILSGFRSDPTALRNTAINDIGTLISATKTFWAGRGDGDFLAGGLEIAVEGGSTYFEPYSLVFKSRSTWLLQGGLPTATDNGSFRLFKILDQGLVAKETIAKSKYGKIWCSGKNVWIATGGGSPVAIGNAIAPMLEQAPFGSKIWSGASFMSGEFYVLTVPSEICGQRVSTAEQWWCDLREFQERGADGVTWWGPMDIPGHVFSGPDPFSPSTAGTYVIYGSKNSGTTWDSGETSIGSMDALGTDADETSGYRIDSWRIVPDAGPVYTYSAVDVVVSSVTVDDPAGLKPSGSFTDTFSGNTINIISIAGNEVYVSGTGLLVAPGTFTRNFAAPAIIQDPTALYSWGFELVGKEFDGGSASLRKIIQRVIVNARLRGTTKLWVRFQGNIGVEVSDPISAQAVSPGFILGTSVMGDPIGVGFRDLVYPSAASPSIGRFIAHTYQPVVYCTIEPGGLLPSEVNIKEITVVIRPIGRLPT